MKKIMDDMIIELEQKVDETFNNMLEEHSKVVLGFTDNMPVVNFHAKKYVELSSQLNDYQQEMSKYDKAPNK